MPEPSNPHTPVTSPLAPRPLRATLQASYHRTPRGLRVRGDNPNAPPPLIFGGVLEEGAYPLAKCLHPGPDDRGDHPPPPLQLTQPNNCYHCHSAAPLSQLRSDHCSRLQAYRHSVGWADDTTCTDCSSIDHTVAHLFSCPSHPTDLTSGICGRHPSRLPIPGRASSV